MSIGADPDWSDRGSEEMMSDMYSMSINTNQSRIDHYRPRYAGLGVKETTNGEDVRGPPSRALNESRAKRGRLPRHPVDSMNVLPRYLAG